MAIVDPDALVELALRPWGRLHAGVIVDRTGERIVELHPNFPIPGPNQVGLVRCAPERVAGMVAEVRELAAARGLRCIWILDPDARPDDLPERLAGCGIRLGEELSVMVLPASADLAPGDAPVEIVDALGDAAAFAAAEAVQAAAFGGGPAPCQEGRFADGREDPARHFFLALLDGEPAGAGWATVEEEGVLLNGGTVAPRFQGRGVYRALLAARLALARRMGVAGLATHAKRSTSAPILDRLGFSTVGAWRAFGECDW
jgi:GNAT superfamily N-acetyltransferase